VSIVVPQDEALLRMHARRELAAAIELVAGSGLTVVVANRPYLDSVVDAFAADAAARRVELVLLERADGAGVDVRVRRA